MINFVRDNLALPADKIDSGGGSSPVAVNPTRKWSPNDTNRVFQALRDIQSYLRSGLLDAASETTLAGLSVVNSSSPSFGPEMDFIGYNGDWVMGLDVANSPPSRDFVVTAQRQDYSFPDGVTTSGSATLTSASGGGFTSALVGKSIGGVGIPAGTTIAAVGGTTSLTMSANATATATGVKVTVTTGNTLDLAYWKHRGALPSTLGIGVTPPDGQARLQVATSDLEPAMGTLRLRRAQSQTGNVLTLHDSNPFDRWWVDSAFYLSGNHPLGGAMYIAADATNQRALVLTDNAKGPLYSIRFPGGNVMRVSYQTSALDILDFQSDGGLRHLSTKLGFYGVSTVTRQTVTALTDNTAGTANDTLQAIPDPADTPATADALRDDLVANALPAIRNDLADLAAKVNAIRTALVNLGLIQ